MAKTSSPRTTKAKTPKVTPTYMAPGTSFTMEIGELVTALQVFEKFGKLDALVEAARGKASVIVDAETVNFVKDFMVKNKMHDDPVGKHIVNARVESAGVAMAEADRGPFRPCSFGDDRRQ